MGNSLKRGHKGNMASTTEFFKLGKFAVVGASSNRSKYGNKVLRKYMDAGLTAIPIHPSETEVEGLAVQQLEDIEDPANTGVSIITPPKVTLDVIEKGAALGFTHFWLQPGAESAEVIAKVKEMTELSVIYGGPCVLVSIDRGEHNKSKV